MPYRPEDIGTTGSILGGAFLVGVIAQFLRQKTDETLAHKNVGWLSVAGGFSAMVIVGLLYEYTDVSPAFLVSIAGIVGWIGIAIMATLSNAASTIISSFLEKKFNVTTLPDKSTTDTQQKGVEDEGTTRTGNQSE